MNRIKKLVLPALLTLLLCACGQRGPLYLPEPAPSNKPEAQKPVPNPDASRIDSERP